MDFDAEENTSEKPAEAAVLEKPRTDFRQEASLKWLRTAGF